MVADGSGKRVPDTLEDGGKGASREEADDGSDCGVDGSHDDECVFERGDSGKAEGPCKALGVLAGDSDRWWWWQCGNVGGYGVREAPVIVDVGGVPGGTFSNDGWWCWCGSGDVVGVLGVGNRPGVVEVWGNPLWTFGGGGVDDFAVGDVERVLDVGAVLEGMF